MIYRKKAGLRGYDDICHTLRSGTAHPVAMIVRREDDHYLISFQVNSQEWLHLYLVPNTAKTLSIMLGECLTMGEGDG